MLLTLVHLYGTAGAVNLDPFRRSTKRANRAEDRWPIGPWVYGCLERVRPTQSPQFNSPSQASHHDLLCFCFPQGSWGSCEIAVPADCFLKEGLGNARQLFFLLSPLPTLSYIHFSALTWAPSLPLRSFIHPPSHHWLPAHRVRLSFLNCGGW